MSAWAEDRFRLCGMQPRSTQPRTRYISRPGDSFVPFESIWPKNNDRQERCAGAVPNWALIIWMTTAATAEVSWPASRPVSQSGSTERRLPNRLRPLTAGAKNLPLERKFPTWFNLPLMLLLLFPFYCCSGWCCCCAKASLRVVSSTLGLVAIGVVWHVACMLRWSHTHTHSGHSTQIHTDTASDTHTRRYFCYHSRLLLHGCLRFSHPLRWLFLGNTNAPALFVVSLSLHSHALRGESEWKGRSKRRRGCRGKHTLTDHKNNP